MMKATPPPLWLLLIVLLIVAPAAAQESGDQQDDEADTADAAQSVTGKYQGKEGMRIQTMCTHCNSANIQIGGLSQDLVPIYRQGYRVIGGLATSMILSILPPDTVAEAKVRKGPSSAAVPGAAAGGVLELIEATPLELPHAEVKMEGGSYGEFSTEMRLAAEDAKDELSGMLTVGTTSVDAVDADKDGWNDIGATARTYAEGRLYFTPHDDHEIDVGVSWIDEQDTFGKGRWDSLYAAFHPDEFAGWVREDTAFDRMEYRAGWLWSLSHGRKLHLRLLAADRDQTVTAQETKEQLLGEFAELRDRFRIDEKDSWGGLEYFQPLDNRGKWQFRTGLETRRNHLYVESLIPLTLPPEYEPGTDRVRESSAYAEVEWGSTQRKWNLMAGVRYDDAKWEAFRVDTATGETEYEQQSRGRASPRFKLRYRPDRAWTFNLTAGRTFRVPKPIMTEVCCGQEYQKSVNTLSETGESLGFEVRFEPSTSLRANLYAARTDFVNHIVRMVGFSSGYTQTYVMANFPDSRAETLEAALRWSPTRRLSFDASMGWISFKNRGDELIEVHMESYGLDFSVLLPFDRIPYVPERSASLTANFNLPGGTILSLGGAYTGVMLIQQFDADNPRPPQPGAPIGNLLQDALRRTSDFWLVNLSAEVPIWRGMTLVVAGNNLTDEIQSDLGDPTTDYNWGPLSGRSWQLGVLYRSNVPIH